MDLKAGLADQSVSFRAWTTATGAAVTVTSATAGLSLWYRRGVTGAKTAISPSDLATLATAHTDGGILVIEGSEHRLDLPDAATAAGVLTVSWGGTATGITILGGTANLIGQEDSAPAAGAGNKVTATLAAGDVTGNLPANAKQWDGGALPTTFAASNLPSDYLSPTEREALVAAASGSWYAAPSMPTPAAIAAAVVAAGGVTTIQVLVGNIGIVSKVNLVAYQYANLGPWTINVSTSQAGASLALVAWRSRSETPAFSLTSAAAEIVVSESGTAITIAGDDTHTQSPGVWSYVLRNLTHKTVVCEGQITVKACLTLES